MKQSEPINAEPVLRPIPYPYRAMLAICSDLDETPDRQVYWQIMRFLNTARSTPMGPGARLEVGNSIYFDMPADQFAYWNTDEAGRNMIRALIRSGHIDCLHSFGDLADTRTHAGHALDELDRYGCRLKVWIDHGIAPTNFGADIMRGHGDEPGHRAYHADLSTQFGIRYVWRGRVTSVLGQDVPPRLGDLWKVSHPFVSARTVAKEWLKHRLGIIGYEKYRAHAVNHACYPAALRDGSAVCEFMRANPCWKGVSRFATADGLGQVLTRSFLDTLVKREGVCLFYTHLGKVRNRFEPFTPETCRAFYRLAERMNTGQILVTTTARLLDYLCLRRSIRVSASTTGTKMTIYLERNRNEGNDIPFHGLSVTVPSFADYEMCVDGKIVPCEIQRMADRDASVTLSIPWPRLSFPDL